MNSVPSLQHMTLVKISVSIINNPQVREYAGNCSRLWDKDYRHCCICYSDGRKRIFRQIMSSLPIPEVLQEKILHVIQPMHCEFQRWRHKNIAIFRVDFGQLNNICWNFLGAIDYTETAKILVRSEDFTFPQLFPVACTHWLADDLKRMWRAASTSDKKTLRRNIETQYNYGVHIGLEIGMKQWIKWLEDGAVQGRLFSYVGDLIYLSRFIPPPIEIFQSLQPAVAKSLRRRILSVHFDTSIGRDFFSKMDATLRMELFKEEPYSALAMFLCWPLQTEFLELASHLYPFLNGYTFTELIHTIISDECAPYVTCFDYKNILNSFWSQSPDALKREAKMSRKDWILQNYILI
ncbi:uncharacterized protein NPIL_266591 [Nephila pilipes]|uniref:Uncharacterized protein n=1 Tax=Nephila pilipes TaxID=299642 RepID=A0A8X6QJZ9_NEPPI|nr:uncharacterized protein NPIL_266591 [Nephila pilipes]